MESEPCRYPYTASVGRQGSGLRVATWHLEAHSGDWTSESAKFAVRWYVREAGNLSVAMETDSGQRLSPEGIETFDGSLFLRVASSHSICPGGSTEVGEVDCGIGTVSHARIHSNFFLALRWC